MIHQLKKRYGFLMIIYGEVVLKIPELSKQSSKTLGIWRFPKIGVPLVIIHFNGVFHYNASICGYRILWKPPFAKTELRLPMRGAGVLQADAQARMG